MKRCSGTAAAVGLLIVIVISTTPLRAQEPRADTVLFNGKIVTVDDRFTIAEAVAIRGERIVAVGTGREIAGLAGPSTRRIDLEKRTVIPGLIDNHMHLLRAGLTWRREVRWDGVDSRRRALDILRTRTSDLGPDEWIFNLGGWTIDQFRDDSRPFTRDELDRAVPDHAVALQAAYYETYLNSRAIAELGLGARADPWIVRDSGGRPTGRIEEAGIRAITAALPVFDVSTEEVEASTAAMIHDLNRAGLTSVGSAGCDPELLEIYRRWADEGRLNLRVFCIDSFEAGNRQQVESALPRIAGLELFQGDHEIDRVAYGEGVYRPLHDPMFLSESDPAPEHLVQWRRVATEVARAGVPLHVHANLENTIGAFLDQIEQIHREHPVKNLRWVFAHFNQPNTSHLERMKRLGMYAAVHPWAVINGEINLDVYGDAAYDMPPLSMIQHSGILWGFGSDGSRANQILPFTTLWFAVTGKMVGGTPVLRQTISREDALIAHTRKNAYFIFQENNLGAIQPGKLADLVVLDRDYLSVPAEQIKDITALLTMVGGRIVYDELGESTSEQKDSRGSAGRR